MEHIEQVELITVLETVSVVLQGVVTVAFISVPSLFYIAAHEGNTDGDDPEEIESMVTTFLTFFDIFIIFLLIAQIIVVFQLKAGFKEKDSSKLKPWLIYNLIFYFIMMGSTIAGIILLTPFYGLHIINFLFLIYRGWTLMQVLLFYFELNKREPLNFKPNGRGEIEVYEL